MIEFKRVVTAVDERCKAGVHGGTALAPTTLGLVPGAEFYQVWGARELPPVPVRNPESVVAPFFPGPGGSRFGLLRIPPEGSAAQPEVERASMAARLAEAQEKLPGMV